MALENLDELDQDELVGNTSKTVREFNKEIKEKNMGQLHNKLRLGAMLIQNFENELDTEPRAQDTIESLKLQMQMLQREIDRRQQLVTIEEKKEETKKQPEAGPLDQVVGMKTLKLTGKNNMG